jgi:RNA polymerase primary sigma factor
MPSRSSLSQFFDSLFDKETMRRRYPHSDTALSAYMQDLGKIPLLTAEQEAQLLLRATQGNAEAQQQLVVSNLRLVITIAARFQGRGLSMLDLIQEGNLGLLKAIERFQFDPEHPRRLSTYAKFWILQDIQRAVAGHGTLLHASFGAGERLQTIRDAIAEFEVQEIEPTAKALARRLDWPLDHVIELLDLMQKPLSLSQTRGEQRMLAERIAAPPLFLSNEITSPELLADVREMISQVLTKRQRLVIENRFGLNDEGVVYSYHEIAAKFFDRTEPRADVSIREMEKNALARLRTAFEGKEG